MSSIPNNFSMFTRDNEVQSQVNRLLPVVFTIDNDPTGVQPVNFTYPVGLFCVTLYLSNECKNTTTHTINVDTTNATLGSVLYIVGSKENGAVDIIHDTGLLYTACGSPTDNAELHPNLRRFLFPTVFNGVEFQHGDLC